MFVTFPMLIQELQRSITVQTYNITDQQIITGIALLPTQFTPDTPLRQDVAYVCEFWQLRQLDPRQRIAPLICVVEPTADPRPVFFTHRSVAVVFGDSLVDTLLALSNVCYDLGCRSSLITEFSHTFLQCKSISELMREGFCALKNPIIVTDQDQKILFYTDPDLVNSPFYRKLISSGHLPLGHPNTSTMSPAWSSLGNPFIATESGNQLSFICKSLSVGDNLLGYMHVMQFHHAFSEQDINITELLSNLLAVELWRSKKDEPRDKQGQMQRFIRDLLDSRLSSAEDTVTRQKQLGLVFKPYLYAAVINIRQVDPAHRFVFSDLVETTAAVIPGCHSLLYRNSVFALIESDTEIFDLNVFLSPLLPILQKYDLICGISNSFGSIFDLRKYGYQAKKSLRLGSTIHAQRRLHLYQDYTVDYMMELCLNRESLDVLCPPAFLRLRRYCEKNGDTLMSTLDTYLRCGRNKSDTAKALFVHLNTVKYRIAQIQEVMGVNLDDDGAALDLMLAFRMLKHQENFQKEPYGEPKLL